MAHGATATQKLLASYGAFAGIDMVPPLCKLSGAVLAPSGSGKSTLVQSIPGALVINVDASSTVISKPQAALWPGLDPVDGAPIVACAQGDEGAYQSAALGGRWVRRFNLTFDSLIKLRDDVVEGYKQGATFPSCIVIDSLDMLVPLAKDYVVRAKGKTVWEDFTGMASSAAWAAVYDNIVDLLRSFKQAGCGFIVTMQMTDKFVTIDETQQKKVFQENVPGISDAFAGRLLPLCEWRGIITVSTEQIETKVPLLDPLNGNKPVIDTKTGQPKMLSSFTPSKVSILSFESDDPKVAKFAKGRQGVTGSIKLPRAGGGWALIEELYRKNTVA